MQVGQKAANLRPVELVVFRVVPDRRRAHLVGSFAQQVSQVRDDGRLRVVAVPVVEHAHGDGKDIGFACGHAPAPASVSFSRPVRMIVSSTSMSAARVSL